MFLMANFIFLINGLEAQSKMEDGVYLEKQLSHFTGKAPITNASYT